MVTMSGRMVTMLYCSCCWHRTYRSYHRNITGAVCGLGEAALLYAGGPVAGQAHHGPVGGVQPGGAVAVSRGDRGSSGGMTLCFDIMIIIISSGP